MKSQREWWRREEFAKKLPNLEKRTRVFAAIRRFFQEEGFLEVETPALQVSPGLETHLIAFPTVQENPFGLAPRTMYLHTSPEFAMKKLLTAGLPKIFQLAKVFRNRERSHTHHPEFTMLEWYRAGAAYTEIMDDTEKLLRACAESAGGGQKATRKEVECDLSLPFERLSVEEAFRRYTEVDLLSTIDDHASPKPDKLANEAKRLGIHICDKDSWEDLFFRIFLERIEGRLGEGRATILYDYPISMAALSRPKSSDGRLAERFEIYVCGLELANAFGELTDARVQRERFEADMAKKEELYGFRYPIDEDFLNALAYGYPESSGIALGVDRLVMLLTGAESIEDVLWAPVAGDEELLE